MIQSPLFILSPTLISLVDESLQVADYIVSIQLDKIVCLEKVCELEDVCVEEIDEFGISDIPC